MAAVTPASLYKLNAGEVTLYVANFANTTDTGDTWSSGIPGIISVAGIQADAPSTQGSTGAGASFSGSTITLYAGEDNSAITLWVLARN